MDSVAGVVKFFAWTCFVEYLVHLLKSNKQKKVKKLNFYTK